MASPGSVPYAMAGPVHIDRTPGRLPLTTYGNTLQNVAAVSALLGVTAGLSLALAVMPQENTKGTDIFLSPRLGIYIFSLTLFHWLEYEVTAVWNPNVVSTESFLLNNGWHYPVAHALALSTLVTASGVIGVVLSQILRTTSMAQAGASFNHFIAKSKKTDHQLVTHGVYSYFRHPAYAAFTYWALSTQLVLRNPISFILFTVVTAHFFAVRIAKEEAYLEAFFDQQYRDYARRVHIWIPFVPLLRPKATRLPQER